MKSFRERMIAWIKDHDVNAHAGAGGVRHEALLDGGLKLIVEYDPLSPQADALMILPLRALPHDQNERAEALRAMLLLNRNLISTAHFAASLYESDGVPSICLLCAAPALAIERAAFEEIVSGYLNIARYARHMVERESRRSPPPQSDQARYL